MNPSTGDLSTSRLVGVSEERISLGDTEPRSKLLVLILSALEDLSGVVVFEEPPLDVGESSSTFVSSCTIPWSSITCWPASEVLPNNTSSFSKGILVNSTLILDQIRSFDSSLPGGSDGVVSNADWADSSVDGQAAEEVEACDVAVDGLRLREEK